MYYLAYSNIQLYLDPTCFCFQVHMKDPHAYEALESLVSCMTECGCGFTPNDYITVTSRSAAPSNTTSLATSKRGRQARTNEGGTECQITQPRFSYQIYTKSEF